MSSRACPRRRRVAAADATARAVSVTEVATASERSNPSALTVGPDGKVWFAAGKDPVDLSFGQPYVGLVDPNTLGVETIPLPVRPFALATSSGAVWATYNDEAKPGLTRIDPATRALEDLPLPQR